MDGQATSSGDEFTSELCQFLSSLATTSDASLEDLAPQLVKLKEVLMRDVVQDQTPAEESGSDTKPEKAPLHSLST